MNELTKYEVANVESLTVVFTQSINAKEGLTYILKTLLSEQLSNVEFTKRISEGLKETEKNLQSLTYGDEPAYSSKALGKKITDLCSAIRKVFYLAKVEFNDVENLIEGIPCPMKLSFKGTQVSFVEDDKKLSELKGKLALAKLSQQAEQKKIELAAEKVLIAEKEKERLAALTPAEKEQERLEKERLEKERLEKEKAEQAEQAEKAEQAKQAEQAEQAKQEKENLENSLKFKIGKILLNTTLKGLKAELEQLLETL